MHESSYANANQTDDVSAAVPMHSTEILPRTKEDFVESILIWDYNMFDGQK